MPNGIAMIHVSSNASTTRFRPSLLHIEMKIIKRYARNTSTITYIIYNVVIRVYSSFLFFKRNSLNSRKNVVIVSFVTVAVTNFAT